MYRDHGSRCHLGADVTEIPSTSDVCVSIYTTGDRFQLTWRLGVSFALLREGRSATSIVGGKALGQRSKTSTQQKLVLVIESTDRAASERSLLGASRRQLLSERCLQ